jgi:hypothetical protein
MSPPIKRNDATGWKRGCGPYSMSYPKVDQYRPPGSQRSLDSDLDDVGYRNDGLAAPVSKSRNHP